VFIVIERSRRILPRHRASTAVKNDVYDSCWHSCCMREQSECLAGVGWKETRWLSRRVRLCRKIPVLG